MKSVVTDIKMISKFRDLPQMLALLSASLSSFSSGSQFAFLSPAIPKLIADYNFTLEEVSYLSVVYPVAMILTAPLLSKVTDKFGRKNTLLATGVLQIMAWTVTAFAQNIYVFYFSRILHGTSDSGFLAALPIYIAEVSTPRVRSLYGNTLSIIWFLGQFLVNCFGFYYNIQTTCLIMLTAPILLLVTFVFMPETPYYLVMNGDMDGATRSLERLRTNEDVNNELKQIISDVQRQMSEAGKFKDLWLIQSNRKALFIACVARLFHQLSGFAAISVYCQYIFQQTGGDISSGAAAMIMSGIFVISVIFSTAFTDRLGRRNSMIVSCIGCGISLLGEAIYFYLQVEEIVDVSIVNWFPVLGIVMYALSLCTGLAVVPIILAGELFSPSIRKYAMPILNILFGLCIGGVSKVFQIMVSYLGLWVPFLIFSACCFVNSIFSYYVIPETKGKTLEEIQQMLIGNKKKDSTHL